MARPSKKTIELRKKIHELSIFKRDNEIYTSFEKLSNDTDGTNTKFNIAYSFCEEAYWRDCNYRNEEKNMYMQHFKERNISSLIKKLDTLNSFSEKLSLYYFCLSISSIIGKKIGANDYYFNTIVGYKTILEALGKNRADELLDKTRLEIEIMCDEHFIEKPLTSYEKKLIIKELEKHNISEHFSTIQRVPTHHFLPHMTGTNKHKFFYTEIDFTKSKEEIIEYVSKIKDDFDKNPSDFKNVFEVLGEQHEPFTCNLQDCKIYKEKNPKPISGRLSDVLFIYDCMNVNKILGADILTKDYITGEITKYWRDTKNISTESFYSFDEYYAIAKDYIDNKRYKDYLSGIKTPPTD